MELLDGDAARARWPYLAPEILQVRFRAGDGFIDQVALARGYAAARLLAGGPASLRALGMTGPHDSIIGVEVEPALSRFTTGMPSRFETASGNPRLNGVIIEADEETGRATDIERLSYSQDELADLADDERPVRSSV